MYYIALASDLSKNSGFSRFGLWGLQEFTTKCENIRLFEDREEARCFIRNMLSGPASRYKIYSARRLHDKQN